MKKKDFIIIAAGGTGGHVFPAVAVANKLKDTSEYDVKFATDKRGVQYLGSYKNTAIVQNIVTKNRYLLYFSLIINVLKSVFYLLKNRPICVVGFGGYPSVPFTLAAQILKIKTIIHEQNAVIGKANKLLSKFASKILTSFQKTKFLQNDDRRIVFVGNPTRFEDLYDSFVYKASDVQKFKILVVGGSQGSKFITENVVNCVCSLPDEIIKNIYVYHQTRGDNINDVMQKYASLDVKNTTKNFFNDMAEIYSNVDLIISRSGASSVFEIIGFCIPAIFIPFAGSINGDQEANADFLCNSGAAIKISEKDFTVEKLKDIICELFYKRKKLQEISDALKKIGVKNVTEKIVSNILS